MPDTREEILKLLSDSAAYFGTYHHHKETSAWASLVLYVLFLAQIITAVDKALRTSGAMRMVTTLSVIVGATIVALYLRKQFSLRRRAADLVAACFALRSVIVSRPDETLNPIDYAPPSTDETRLQSNLFLPKAIQEKADEMREHGQGSRVALERYAYLIVFVVSVIGLARIWIVATQ